MILPADLQLSVDFKPESPDGIIMLTGETVDMKGDYLALLLRDGYAELVLELGTNLFRRLRTLHVVVDFHGVAAGRHEEPNGLSLTHYDLY